MAGRIVAAKASRRLLKRSGSVWWRWHRTQLRSARSHKRSLVERCRRRRVGRARDGDAHAVRAPPESHGRLALLAGLGLDCRRGALHNWDGP